MKIALLISSLRSGGAERVASIVASHWARKQWDVLLFTLSGKEERPFYDLDPAVRHVPMGMSWIARNPFQGVANNLRRAWLIRREIEKAQPDVLISFMDTTNVLAILATRGLGIPLVVSERSNPAAQTTGPVWRLMRNLLYSRANAVAIQTERVRACFPLPVRTRCVVIPNPVLSPAAALDREAVVVPKPALVAVGRLSAEKGFHLLISVFARLLVDCPDWHLVIVGDGPQRAELERQSDEMGIRNRVLLLGQVRDPNQILRQSDIFVLPSRYEGFPNALCEAMACGLPVVSFDCPFGPAEIIRDGVDGILVPQGDSSALAESLGRLMRDEGARHRLAQRAPEIVERFALDKVMDTWEETLRRVVP